MCTAPPFPRKASGAAPTARRRALLGLGLLGVYVAVGLGSIRLVAVNGAPNQVYSVAAVRTLVNRAPTRWLSRELVVRALAEPCPWWGATARIEHCASQAQVLIGAPGEAPAEPLPLVPPTPQPLLSLVRSLPILGDLLPRSPVLVLHWSTVATNRIRLQAIANSICGTHTCYQATLLAAAP
jgi:hypothetical protein